MYAVQDLIMLSNSYTPTYCFHVWCKMVGYKNKLAQHQKTPRYDVKSLVSLNCFCLIAKMFLGHGKEKKL
jgi:hypothetical protein